MSEEQPETPDEAVAAEREPEVVVTTEEMSIRRAPKVSVFIVLGAGIGAIVAFILTAAFEIDPLVGFGATFGYLALYAIPAGIVVFALLALLLDWRASRRARTVTVQREDVS